MEKYFVCAFNEDGTLEPVIWFETLKKAQKYADEWKTRYPKEAKDVFIGELLIQKEKEG